MTDNTQQADENIQNDEIDMERLQQDLDQAMNGWKRTAADFENYKKRKEAENKELLEFAKEVTVTKLLPTIDSLEQALRHLPQYPSPQSSRAREEEGSSSPLMGEDSRRADEDENDFSKKYQSWQQGINVLLKQLDKTLEELGVKKIEAIGKKFDPYKHEAVRQVNGEEDDVVVDELQTGFELNGKVLRPSQVVISKKK